MFYALFFYCFCNNDMFMYCTKCYVNFVCICRRMVDRIHTLVIHHEDEELEWKFDEDYLNYMGLCSALCSELAAEEDFTGKRTLNISIYAVVEGSADVINIENDASLMRMFQSNVDTANPIDVYVDFEEMEATVDPAKARKKESNNL